MFLISMFVVPLVSLVGLWAFSAVLTVPGAISDHSFSVYSTTPPARIAAVSRPLLAEPLSDESLAASPDSAASIAAKTAEISQIARSFGTVQEAAVAAAMEQARLRKGVNQVVLNISMRNQSLLHRQLGMLDAIHLPRPYDRSICAAQLKLSPLRELAGMQ